MNDAVRARLLLASLFGLQLLLGLSFIKSAAPTYDEPVHLASGYSYLADGRYRLNIKDHPPLAEMWAALPLLALDLDRFTSHTDWVRGRVYHYSDIFLFRNRVPAERMMTLARVFLFLTTAALAAFALARWAGALGGTPAAAGTLLAAALCPVWVSNAALVTTDGLSAALFFAALWLLSSPAKTRARWAAAGACAGLALGSKFNMILLPPLAAGLLAIDRALSPKPRRGFDWAGAALASACALLALAVVYRFQLSLYWEGLAATLKRLENPRPSFLLGEHSMSGFRGYYPVALALKTPIPLLLAAAGGAAAWLKRRDRAALWVLLPPAAYFAAALTAKIQIGVRHLMPIFPFLALAAGCGGALLWKAGPRGRAAAGLLAAWAVLSVGRVHPHQLAYFNELAGGPRKGHLRLLDSNLDWGQDLKALARTLSELGAGSLYLSYFGSADPAAYGLRYVPVGMCCNVARRPERVDPASEGKALLAVSATNRAAVYFENKDLFSWLDGAEAVPVPGHSIFLYDLTGDKERRAKLADLVFLSTGDPGSAGSLVVE